MPTPLRTYLSAEPAALCPLVPRAKVYADRRTLFVSLSLQVGTAALAYAVHKAASPIRFPPTVALTPVRACLNDPAIRRQTSAPDLLMSLSTMR